LLCRTAKIKHALCTQAALLALKA